MELFKATHICQWHNQEANMRFPTSCHQTRCPSLCSPASGRLESFLRNKPNTLTKGRFQVGEPQLTHELVTPRSI